MITSVNESSKNSFVKFYPNPIKGVGTLEFLLDIPATISYAVYDILGKKVLEKSIDYQLSTGKHDFNIDTKDLDKGSYFIQYKIQDKMNSLKFIVDK